MESLEDVLVAMELKYCERCGSLWLRETNVLEIYCPGCAPEMAGLPRRRARRVLMVDSVEDVEACLMELSAVCGEGGNA
jgi:hypothetical protein